MSRRWHTYVLSTVVIAACSIYTQGLPNNTFAQQAEATESETEDLKWQLKQMEESVLRQQEQIQALKNRVEGAAASKEEIKHEVENYLSSDEARKKMGLGMPGVTALYTPDGDKYSIVFKSADEKYSLGIGGRVQFRYAYKDNDSDFGYRDTNNIDVRRARLSMGGNVYGKQLHYYLELDGDSFDVGVRDFYVYWTPLEELNAKIGYFKVPFNRERMTSSAKLLFQDRAIASEAFDQDRDYGVDIYGKPFDGHMEYHAAIFNGAGENPEDRGTDDNLDNELMYVLSARYNPFGKYDYYDETDVAYSDTLKATIGASVAFNSKKKDEKLEDTDAVVGTVDLGVKYKGISWNNEYYVMSEDPEDGGETLDSDGFLTQVGYFVIPKKLEFDIRYSMLDPNNDVSNDIGREYAAGVNYYFRAHRSKIQADYGHYVTEEGEGQDKQENRVRVQYQIVF